MKTFSEVLKSYIGQNKLIAIFDDEDNSNDFYLGFVLKVDEEFVLINSVNKFGEIDGFRAILISSIFEVEESTMYCKKIMKLFELKKQKREDILLSENSSLEDILNHAIENELLIKINFNDDKIGYIKEYDKEIITMLLVNSWHEDLGLAFYKINDIFNIKLGTKILKDIQLLKGFKM